MALIEYKLYFDDEKGQFVAVNPENGEIREFVSKKSTSSTGTTTRKKKVVDDNPNPQITLEEKKYCLNNAAVELMGVEPEMKLCIKMRKVDGIMTPIIGTTEAFKVKDGNRITKSFTVACRGANHDALVSYGTIFDLVENPDNSGTFIMKGDQALNVISDDVNIDNDIELPDELNVNLDDLDESEIPTELDGSDFESMLNGIDADMDF